jgi:hypothetical protein
MLNPVAAPCVLSIAGAVQVTMRSLPVPRASSAALGVFGAGVTVTVAAPVVCVLVADHALAPAAFVLWS